MRQLLIRADATSAIGTGHVMRCLALAQEWQAHAGSVTLVSHTDDDTLPQRVENLGIKFVAVAEPHPHPSDLQSTQALLAEKSFSHVVLDGYHFDPAYQQNIHQSGCRTLIIDDWAHQPHYSADVLLNQNLGADQFTYHCAPGTALLLGPTYALLRNEFLRWRGFKREIPTVARKILITMGGADPANVTERVVRALHGLDIGPWEAAVIVGASNPHHDRLVEVTQSLFADRGDCSVRLLRNPPNIPELMAWADLAVAAGGSTCWELAFMGLPAILTVLADNQRSGAQGLVKAGVVVDLGWYEQISSTSIIDAVTRLATSYDWRLAQSMRGRDLIDGYGVSRVLAAMTQLGRENNSEELTMRRAGLDDADRLWRLANDPVVRQNSFSPDSIPLSQHLAWFRRKLDSADCLIWILESEGEFAAQIRYDRLETDVAEIDFAVAPEFRGKGLGTQALILTRPVACREMQVRVLRGTVMEANVASMRAFLKAGFDQKQTNLRGEHPCALFEWQCDSV